MDGKPLREHLESIHRQTGVMPDALADAVTLPDGCEMLWRDFLALHGTRASTGFGPARIGYSDLDAYQRVQGCRLPAWQIEAIRRADNAYLAHYAETHRPKK